MEVTATFPNGLVWAFKERVVKITRRIARKRVRVVIEGPWATNESILFGAQVQGHRALGRVSEGD